MRVVVHITFNSKDKTQFNAAVSQQEYNSAGDKLFKLMTSETDI